MQQTELEQFNCDATNVLSRATVAMVLVTKLTKMEPETSITPVAQMPWTANVDKSHQSGVKVRDRPPNGIFFIHVFLDVFRSGDVGRGMEEREE